MRSVLAALALGYVAVASAFMSGVLSTALLAMRVMMLVVFHPCVLSALLANPTQPRHDEQSLKVCLQLHIYFQCSKFKIYCANFLSYACKCIAQMGTIDWVEDATKQCTAGVCIDKKSAGRACT
jgi:hypothetical protein